MLYPWQTNAWHALMHNQEHWPHALLIYGANGIGTLTWAEAVQAALLCETPQKDGQACGVCSSCHWLIQNNHPDALRICPDALAPITVSSDEVKRNKTRTDEPEQKTASKEIRIEQIRQLIDATTTGAHRSAGRVVLLYPLEAMNMAAANALLKILEEPPPSTRFIAVSHRIDAVLPTILSRCRKIPAPRPNREQALAWLKTQHVSNPPLWLAQTGNEPLTAMQWAETTDAAWMLCLHALKQGAQLDVAKIAEQLAKQSLEPVLAVMQRWAVDLLCASTQAPIRSFIAETKTLTQLSDHLNLHRLDAWLTLLNTMRRQSGHPLVPRLQLEKCLLHYVQLWSFNT
jgi:DNA polymerase III subunit delta'